MQPEDPAQKLELNSGLRRLFWIGLVGSSISMLGGSLILGMTQWVSGGYSALCLAAGLTILGSSLVSAACIVLQLRLFPKVTVGSAGLMVGSREVPYSRLIDVRVVSLHAVKLTYAHEDACRTVSVGTPLVFGDDLTSVAAKLQALCSSSR